MFKLVYESINTFVFLRLGVCVVCEYKNLYKFI